MTTNDIRAATGTVAMEWEEYRNAVMRLCDDYDKLMAASTDLLHFLHSEPSDILDIPDRVYVPFADEVAKGE
jgi:hypothetical protein